MKSLSISRERRALWLMMISCALGYFLFSDLVGATLFAHEARDSYTLQALAWLKGRLDLGRDYEWLELAVYQGKFYVSFPPVPTIPLIPLALLFGEATPNNALCGVYGLISLALSYKIMLHCGRKPETAAFWAIFTVWGSNMMWMTTHGGVWFQAQALNMALCLGAVSCAVKQRRAVSTLLLALAVGCRPFSALYIPAFLFAFAWQDRSASGGFFRALARQWKCLIGPAAVAAVLMGFNFLRFGNVLEFGHNYLPEFVEAPYGQFSLRYLPGNLKKIFLSPVTVREGQLSFSLFDGFMFYLANPMFLVLFIRQFIAAIKRRFSAAGLILAIAMAANLVLLCLHKSFGGWQFGARYTVDLIPFALMYLALRAPERPGWWEWLLGAFGIAFNIYGALYMYFRA